MKRFSGSFLVLSAVLTLACGGSAPAAPDGGGGPVPDAATLGGDAAPRPDGGPAPAREVPRAVEVARATEIPACTLYVDAASSGGDGSIARPYASIAEAVAAATDGAVVCVAEGVYAEVIEPGETALTLAGGFASGRDFAVRDSSVYVSRAQGDGTGAFVRIEGDAAPRDEELTAVDGFEITGYERGVLRATYFSQRFSLTNNYIHDNHCTGDRAFGGGFLLSNVDATVEGNVVTGNSCGFGGGGAVIEDVPLEHDVMVQRNRFEGNAGDDADCHGGGLFLMVTTLSVSGNDFLENTCTSWGGGLYVGAAPPQRTTATLAWNVFRGNRADNAGGGFFCDDGAACIAEHEIYDGNCGGNILVDSGYDPAVPTIASFDHVTSHGARAVGCGEPGAGLIVTKENEAPDAYTFTSSVFWGNGDDIAAFCDSGCSALSIRVSYSTLALESAGNATVTFGEGNLDAADPLFVDADAGDFHLRSTRGHWSPLGYVSEDVDSPALAAGDPSGDVSAQPERAGPRSEMGAYGNSAEASYTR